MTKTVQQIDCHTGNLVGTSRMAENLYTGWHWSAQVQHLSMQASSRQLQHRTPRDRSVTVVLLLICALVTQSLAVCTGCPEVARHESSQAANDTPTSSADTPTCCLAAGSDRRLGDEQTQDERTQPLGADDCPPTPTIAAVAPLPYLQIDYQPVTLAATVAVIPATPQLITVSGCLHGRAGPPPTPFLTSSLRSSLPNRAPPLSA